MSRIIIKDLPGDKKISKEEMKKLFGGAVSGYKFHPRIGFTGNEPYVVSDPSRPLPPHLPNAREPFQPTFLASGR